MKTIKLTKKMLKMHPTDLLVKLGAVDKEKTQVYPTNVYFSKNDYQELKENLIKHAKKMYPQHLISHIVGMELLNYGPNQSLENAIKPGWALVDLKGIEKET